MSTRHASTFRLLGVNFALAGLMGVGLFGIAWAQFFPHQEPTNADIWFGCDPGPIEELDHADPPVPPRPVASRRETTRAARLVVHNDAPGHTLAGAGFNLEHTLWSCQPFRRVLRRWILEPFQPELARVDAGQLPFAPDYAPAEWLNWDVYQRMMDDPKYAPGWQLLKRLNRDDVKLMLGVWGAPGAFTDDGTRRGRLLPRFIDKYVEYYTAVVDYLVRRQGIRIWAATVMNEPDGGDGSDVDPDDYVEIARKLGPSLARYGVLLYGPDTASAEHALPYVERLLDEPSVLAYFAAIATHEYSTDNSFGELLRTVRQGGSNLPIYATEYTSFQFGALDRGQEASNEIGHMLDSLQVLANLLNGGADAALYWDAVDYYQAGHAAITRWGLLQGPDEAFEPRKRYFGFLQIVPYLQPGSQVLQTTFSGPQRAIPLAIAGGPENPAHLLVALVNRGGPLDLALELAGPAPAELQMYVTDVERDSEAVGRVRLVQGQATVNVPARSVTTLTVGPAPDEDE